MERMGEGMGAKGKTFTALINRFRENKGWEEVQFSEEIRINFFSLTFEKKRRSEGLKLVAIFPC